MYSKCGMCCCFGRDHEKDEDMDHGKESDFKKDEIDQPQHPDCEEVLCKVVNIYVDISEERMLHYKQCEVHGKTVPVNLKTALYKSNFFYHHLVSSDFSQRCILDNRELPGVEKNISNPINQDKRTVADIRASSSHKFKLTEEDTQELNCEILQGVDGDLCSCTFEQPKPVSSGDHLPIVSSHARRLRSILVTTRRQSADEAQTPRMKSKSVFFLTPDHDDTSSESVQ